MFKGIKRLSRCPLRGRYLEMHILGCSLVFGGKIVVFKHGLGVNKSNKRVELKGSVVSFRRHYGKKLKIMDF